MRCYITSRFKNARAEQANILALCDTIRNAGFEDVSFIRDIEQFDPHHFSSQQEVWSASLELLSSCDCLFIDVTDAPSGGRIVEAGMAFALGLPIYVAVQGDAEYKSFYDGIATTIIRYTSLDDLATKLRR
jgi:nucleoside 2-deoxyribosyltransferase